MVDLSKLKVGDYVRLRGGDTKYRVTLSKYEPGIDSYPYTVATEDYITGHVYTPDGQYWRDGRMSDFDIVEIIPNTNEETREINSGLVFIGRNDANVAIYLRPDDIRKIETPDVQRQVYRVYTYQDAEAHIILQPASVIYDLIKQGVKPL